MNVVDLIIVAVLVWAVVWYLRRRDRRVCPAAPAAPPPVRRAPRPASPLPPERKQYAVLPSQYRPRAFPSWREQDRLRMLRVGPRYAGQHDLPAPPDWDEPPPLPDGYHEPPAFPVPPSRRLLESHGERNRPGTQRLLPGET